MLFMIEAEPVTVFSTIHQISNMRLFILVFSCFFSFVLVGQSSGYYNYREPFATVDTLAIHADYFEDGIFQDYKPLQMICTGDVIPALMDNIWGSTRCYKDIRYLKPDGEFIKHDQLVMIYGIDENYARWRPDD